MAHKVDAVLGEQIVNHLIDQGLMLPMTANATKLTNEEKIGKLTELFAQVLDVMGYDLTDEELVDTPERVAKVYVNDWFYAFDPTRFPKCKSFDNKGLSFNDEMVIVKDIRTTSNCAHHLTITDCHVDVAYIAGEKMIGISKLNHIVDHLAKNPTSQETLGKAIAETISLITESDDVIVRISGVHYCVVSRSAKDRNSRTVTLAAKGKFQENRELRKEFMSQLTAR